MNKNKRNAKILTSLQETTIQTKMSGKNFSVKIVGRGEDGKKGTDDDKIHRKSKTKIKGDSMKEGFKVGDKVKIKTSGLTRQTERGFKRYLGKSGKIIKDYGDGDMKVNLGGNNDISINSKDLVKEGSSDTTDMYKLMIKGMKAMPGSPKQKEIIKQINVIRKRLGMKPMTEEIKVAEDKKWHWYNLDRGVYKMQKDNLGRIRGKEMDRKSEVRNGFSNAVEVLSTVKQAAKYVEKKNGLNEASEWEEVFGDSTYQDSYWGDPATIRGKIEVARNKVKAKQNEDEEDEEQDHKIHQQRTNESKKKTYDQFIKEARGTTAVFTFGRFNPPTIGHEKLLKVVANTASKERADQYVFPSHSQDVKKNPLSNDQKVVFMKMMFPEHRSSIVKSNIRNAFEAASKLHELNKYSKIIMVVGSDRVREFNTVLNKYNDVEGRHGYYRFDDIDVISAGERDPDSDGVSGMSASKMRAAVSEGNYDVFKMGVPAGVSDKDCETLYNAVAKGMRVKQNKIREDWEFDSLWESDEEKFDDLDEKSKVPSKGLSPSQRRRMALRMKIMAKKPSFIMKRKRAMKRAATKAKLLVRARKAAIQKVVKKFYPKLKTKSRSELSYAERGKISQIVKKKAAMIARFAKRMVKDKRKQDVERRASMNKPKDK